MSLFNSKSFITWLRSVAPYVRAFRGRTFVIACSGDVIASPRFAEIVQDINLVASLGIRIVLVHGARPQIEAQLRAAGVKPIYSQGLRITDDVALRCVKQAVGITRVEIEALLSQGTTVGAVEENIVRINSGNFVTAQPIGVRKGVDFMHTGKVRKIDGEGIKLALEQDNMVLLSPLGYSPTGEIFNLGFEDVATNASVTLQADKLIFLVSAEGILDSEKNLLRELTTARVEKLLQQNKDINTELLRLLPCALRACKQGVRRIHFVGGKIRGGLLLELFTHEGVGSMITQDALEQIRPAKIEDVGCILDLIKPLEEEGALVKRSREWLEMEIDRFMVLEHDSIILGCAALYPFAKEKSAELACLAVDPNYQDKGYGGRLLKAIEARARSMKIRKLFVLTTLAAHWFIERGFKASDVNQLPEEKKLLYNYQRKSKVFVKKL